MDDAVRSRRGFIKAIVVGTSAGAVGAVAHAEGTAKPTTQRIRPPASKSKPTPHAWRFFNRDEVRVVEAAIERLIPADELGPGAREADVAVFLDMQLAGAWGSGDNLYRQGPFVAGTAQQGYQLSFTPAEMFRMGLAKLDEAAKRAHGGSPFADLTPTQQDALLTQTEQGQVDFGALPSGVFFAALLDATVEGFFGDPMYGGNRDMIGWKLVGFPGVYASYANDIERHGIAWTRQPESILDGGGHHRGAHVMSRTMPAVDDVIVGAGWTGAVIGKELAASGQRVVVLERGQPRWTSPDFQAPGVHDELKYLRRHELHQNTASETFTFRNDTQQTALPMRRWQFAFPANHLGGGGAHWSGAYYRFDAPEFRLRSHYTERYGASIFEDGITAQDWPLSYDELEPYYDRFDYLIGASGYAGNLGGRLQPSGNPFELWRSRPYPNPPLKVPYASALFGEAAAKLGYHPYIQPSALATRPYTNTEGLQMNACVYCGFCSNFGCEHFAKASPQVCVLPVALKLKTLELRTSAHVLRVELDKDRKHARGVTYVDAAGEEVFQPADVVLLCAFGIQNVRLLLLSGIGAPYDSATGDGVVGRNYTHQTTSSVSLFFDESVNINPFMAAGAVAVTMDDFCSDNFDHGPHGFVGGGYIQIQVVSGAPISNRPTPRGTPAWGGAWKKGVKRYYNHAMPITITGSSLPVRDGYLSLDPTYKDAWGQPLLRITYDFAANDIKLSTFLTDKGTEIGRAMRGVTIAEGNPRAKPYNSTGYQSTHLTGGAATGNNPKSSVVNRYGQCWDVPNMFVTGVALFPQNSCCNPTGTVGALAYWTADAIKRDYLRAPGSLIAS